MAPKTAPGWERSIREALAKLPEQARLATVGLYVLMRQDFEDKFPTAGQDAPSAALLPPNRPAILAGREAASVAACVGRLMAVGLVVDAADGGGLDLPHVRRICEIHERDRSYKAKPPPETTPKTREVGIPTRKRSEVGSEFRSELRPPPSPASSPAPPPALFLSPTSPSPIPTPLPTPNSTPNPSPPAVRQPPRLRPEEEVYQAYPKKVGKGEALPKIKAAYGKLARRGELDPWGYLLERTRAYATVREQIHAEHPTEKRYTLNPSTFFHQERYDDDPSAWEVLYDQPRAAPKTARAAEIERFGKAMDSILGATSDDNPRIGSVHEGAQRLLPGGHRGAGPAGGGDRPANGRPHRDRRAQDAQAASRLFQCEDDH